MDIAPVHLFHCHRGQGEGSVNEIFKPCGHSVAVERIAEQQQVAAQHLLQNLTHIIVDGAMSAVVFADKAAAAKLDMLVSHINRTDFLRGSFSHAVQKCTGNVHGIAFLFLWTSVKNKDFHL